MNSHLFLHVAQIKFNFIEDLRSRMATNPSIFTSDEYRAWLRRAPSSSAICEQMRASRDILNQQRAHRFSCSAENIHDALKHVRTFLFFLENYFKISSLG